MFQLIWFVLCRFTLAPMHRWRCLVLKVFGAKLGSQNHIYPTCTIWAPWLLETGDGATIGPGVEVYNPGGLYLGKKSILSQNSYICGATHDYDSSKFTYVPKKIIIDSYAWVCARAIVLPGVVCSTGSVLAAGAVTSKNLDEWAVYGGNPARKIRDRVKVFDS